MAKLAKVQPLVYNALLNNPETRKDDHLLILEVYKNYVNTDLSLKTVLEHHIELGLPSIVSIARIRRKVQKKHPELIDQEAADIREEEETVYKNYSVS